MPESQNHPSVTTSEWPKALLLCGEDPSSEDQNLAGLLNLFGIPWKAVNVREIAGTPLPANVPRREFCILSSATCVAEAIQDIEDPQRNLPRWMMEASSVYIYGFKDTDRCRRLLRLLTNDAQWSIHKLNTTQTFMSITSDFPELCGPMSGMRVLVDPSAEVVFGMTHQVEKFDSIIRANAGEVFFRVTCRGVPFYLNLCGKIVDVSSPSAKYFDVKRLFCEAVPTTMYLKWAFRDVSWISPETSACLIVDDPVLKPRYGFMHFLETLELMDRHNFTTTIAFIPWNWRRTNPRTIAILQQRPDRFSLSVHGCDHTASEFTARSTAVLNRKIKTASQRMEFLCQRTSLHYDRVMVFPQGAFSPETGRALKLNGFFAAVNTEVAPSNNASNETTIGDLWNVAIMKYGTFPIFTRRYLTHGIENFAFDALLGKPCLIVAHHDVFKDHGSELVNFIAKLNSLNWKLRWRPLGDAIRHSFKVHHSTNGTSVIQMFAENLVLENPSGDTRETVLMKEEADVDLVKAVMVNETVIDFTYDAGYLHFRVKLCPKEAAEVRIVYYDRLLVATRTDSIGYSINTRARRHLSEFRDNYLSQWDFLYESAARIRQLLK